MSSADDTLTDLVVALNAAADALVRLPPEEFAAMCREEALALQSMREHFDALGWPTPDEGGYPPESVLGRRIVELAVARHPGWAPLDPAGEA